MAGIGIVDPAQGTVLVSPHEITESLNSLNPEFS
jgi:hypothetical protein